MKAQSFRIVPWGDGFAYFLGDEGPYPHGTASKVDIVRATVSVSCGLSGVVVMEGWGIVRKDGDVLRVTRGDE